MGNMSYVATHLGGLVHVGRARDLPVVELTLAMLLVLLHCHAQRSPYCPAEKNGRPTADSKEPNAIFLLAAPSAVDQHCTFPSRPKLTNSPTGRKPDKCFSCDCQLLPVQLNSR